MKTLIVLLMLAVPYEKQCLDLDLIILCDYSSSVHQHQNDVYKAVDGLVTHLDVEGVNIAVITFSSEPTLICGLTDDASLIKSKLKYMPFAYGGTDMVAAFDLAATELLQGHSTKRMIILISDGDPDDEELTIHSVNKLQSLGIGLCGVHVGEGKPEFLRHISSQCYVETTYADLAYEIKRINFCL